MAQDAKRNEKVLPQSIVIEEVGLLLECFIYGSKYLGGFLYEKHWEGFSGGLGTSKINHDCDFPGH